MEEGGYVKEQWNQAAEYHRRISTLLSLADYYSMVGNAYGWSNCLKRINMKIYAKLKPEQKKVSDRIIDKLNKGFVEAKKNNSKSIPTFLLLQLENFLMEMLEERSMLTPKSVSYTHLTLPTILLV